MPQSFCYNMFGKKKGIEFSVDDKPPKKTKPSLWSEDSPQTNQVINLRTAASIAYKESKLDDHFHGPVKLTLTIHDPNPLERKDRHDYLGDLDGLVGGVIESLQPLPPEINNLRIDPKIKDNEKNCHVIVDDDAQISTFIIKKRENEKTFYEVCIESDKITN